MKFKVGDRVKVVVDNAAAAVVLAGDEGTIVEIESLWLIKVKMDITRSITNTWVFVEYNLILLKPKITPKQAFELIKKASSEGPTKMEEHSVKEALNIIYKYSKLGFTNASIDFTNFKKAKKLATKLEKIGFKVWLHKDSCYIELEW